MIEENQGTTVTSENYGGEGTQTDTISLSKSEYEELVGMKSSYGSLKREFKDLKKALEEKTTTPQQTKAADSTDLVVKTYLRTAGITAEDEVELALTTAKKWGIDVDRLVDDEDFKSKLEKHRTNKANLEATSNIRGDKSGSTAKDSADYWLAKGQPPTPDQVPDSKTRRSIARAFMKGSGNGGKKFYSD